MKISLPTWPLTSLLSFSLLSLGPATAALAHDQQLTPAEWVRRLGSDVFQEREEATQSLEKLGVEAREALAEGLTSPDAEIVRRCRILLPLIESQEMELLIKKISAPNADPEGLKLPGWERFKNKIGSDPEAKKFYLELCRAELPLMRDVERKPENGLNLIQQRIRNVSPNAAVGFQRVNAIPVAQVSETELGAVLFCALNPQVTIPPNSQFPISSMLRNPSARAMIQRSDPGTPLRRLVAQWLTSSVDFQIMISNLHLAKDLALKEAPDMATRILENLLAKKIAAGAYQKGMAICALDKISNKSHVKLLLPFFSDDTIIQLNNLGVGNNINMVSTQVNDIALAHAIHLTGQDHRSYQFYNAEPGRVLRLDSPYSLGFGNQKLRDEAFAKWSKWMKETNFDPNAVPAKPEGTVSKPASPNTVTKPAAPKP